MAKATKKKTAKRAPKKVAGEDTRSDAPTKKKREKRKGGGRKRDGKALIVYFMNSLIQAGLLGEEIPEETSDRRALAQAVRQMAEQLARQVRKFEGDDVPAGGDAGDADDADDAEDGEDDGEE